MSEKLKILISYHKPSELFKDEIYTPIHLGRVLAMAENKDGKMSETDFKWLCKNMIGDDTGENISHLNHYFNEMTGVFWAWKNYDKLSNPDYIGFASYRCLFSTKKDSDTFLSPSQKTKQKPYYNFNDFSQFYPSKEESKTLQELTKNYDFITNIPVETKGYNIIEEYNSHHSLSQGHILNDFKLLEKLIEDNFSEYNKDFKEYIQGNKHYYTNMFVMKRKLFFKYCEFIFPILFKYHESIDYSNRNASQKRMFISERLTAVFYEKLIKSGKYRYTQLSVNTVYNPSLTNKPDLAFDNHKIALVFAVDSAFLPYLYVALKSLIENSNPNSHYDICILNCGIDKNTQNNFFKEELRTQNISIRFVDIATLVGKTLIENRNLFYTSNHIKTPTYYRFFIPELFDKYERVVYLDTDMIFLNDVAQLYDIKLEGKMLAACRDLGIYYQMQTANEFFRNYLIEKLEMKNVYNYFQAGLIIYDIKKCLNIDFTKLCLQKLSELKKPLLHDQDVLNSCFEDKIQFLALKYNYTWNLAIKFPDCAKCFADDIALEYKQAGLNPSIIHYCDSMKPWNNPFLEKSEFWWSYARKTPYYEHFIFSQRGNPKHGALNRVKNHLSYKLGFAMVNAKSANKILKLPFTLISLILQHKKDVKIYESMSRINPNLKLPPLEQYDDYYNALNAQKHLSYRLGKALIKNPLSFIFKINAIYKDYKKEKIF